MQIHELTSRQLNEGIIDALKVSLSKDPAIDGMTYKQANQYLKTSKATEQIAKKAQQAWEVYAKQLEQFISTQPVTTSATQTATATNKPLEVLNVAGGTATKGADGKWRNQAGAEYNASSIEKLEKMAGQRRQMSPASGIKEAVATAASPIEAFRNRTDGKYKQALKAFVQKNLLSGMQYSRLANAQEIEQLINLISRPENATPDKQAPLWRQLAQAAAVAYTVPPEAGGLGTPETVAGGQPETDTTPKDESPAELVGTVKQAMEKNKVDSGSLAKAGETIRKDFTNNDAKIKSTGNSAVDALLKTMGFEI